MKLKEDKDGIVTRLNDEIALYNVECPLQHNFAPGAYLREMFMPAGTFVIGHEHLTEHFNIVLSGRARVMMDGQIHEITGPSVFVSKPGVRKVLFIYEDMRWCTLHPTEETDLEILENLLINKSPNCLEYEEEIKRLLYSVKIREALTDN